MLEVGFALYPCLHHSGLQRMAGCLRRSLCPGLLETESGSQLLAGSFFLLTFDSVAAPEVTQMRSRTLDTHLAGSTAARKPYTKTQTL